MNSIEAKRGKDGVWIIIADRFSGLRDSNGRAADRSRTFKGKYSEWENRATQRTPGL